MSEEQAMPGRPKRLQIAAFLAATGFVLATTLGLARSPAGPDVPKAAVETALYYGSGSCVGCHTQPQPQLKTSFDHVNLNEFEIWAKKDKHSLAYKNLNNDLGQAMARRLGKDVTKAETGCLGCHSASVAELRHVVEETKQGDAFKLEDGVSCENCHGPAENWIGPHAQSAWRNRPASYKALRGMNDLRTPQLQAEKCLSCHIGNKDEQKVVTHAMYAVGHPPLPSIEVASFGDQIPRHWRLLAEKPESARKNPAYAQGELERSKLAVVSAAVALKTVMGLLADVTKLSEGNVSGLAWPDFARFDCTSCHHELERPSWRQERGYASAPGRPPVVRWPLFLVGLAVEKLVLDDPNAKSLHDDMKGYEAAINEAMRVKPFGRANEVGAAAAKYTVWAESLVKKLSQSKFDRKSVAALLKKLVNDAAKTDLDYDAARHVAWTIWAFSKDLGPDPTNQKEFARILDRMTTGLRLELPAGQEKSIEKQLADALRTMGEYKPSVFRNDLKALAPLLSY